LNSTRENARLFRVFLLVFAVLTFLTFYKLGSFTLFDVDEAVFGQATKEMVQTGSWMTPTYNGVNRYDKPILFYWLMCLSYGLFGFNEFAARLPSALAGLALCWLSWGFIRRFYDPELALFSCVSMGFSLLFYVYSHMAITDMALTLFISLSLFSFFAFYRVGEEIYLILFYLFSALAFLTKGLIGLFPLVIAILFSTIEGGLQKARKILNWRGLLIFLVVALPWYMFQLHKNGKEFIELFIIKHHFKRYTGVISGHRGPVFYYVVVLIAGMFPWIGFLLRGVRNVFRMKRDLLTFALIWFLSVLAFFSLATTKLPNYILISLPAISILIASGMKEQEDTRRVSLLTAILSSLLCIGFLISKTYISKLGIGDFAFLHYGFLIFLILTLASLCFAAVRVQRGLVLTVFAVICSAFLFYIPEKAIPVASHYLQGTLYSYSLFAKENLGRGGRLFTYKLIKPSVPFYSDRSAPNILKNRELKSLGASKERILLIAKAKDAAHVSSFGFNVLQDDGTYALLEKNISF